MRGGRTQVEMYQALLSEEALRAAGALRGRVTWPTSRLTVRQGLELCWNLTRNNADAPREHVLLHLAAPTPARRLCQPLMEVR